MLRQKLMGGAGVEPAYIEDFFQTWLSTGTGTTRTVTGPDMTKGGLSITKSRSSTTGWRWVDTARGAGLSLESNSSNAQASEATGVTAFTATGTSIGADADYNTSGATYVDFLIRKQPKLFDVVTYTGNGANRTIAHSLGSVPGCIIVKKTSGTAQNWGVYHISLGATQALRLNSNLDAASIPSPSTYWNNTAPTSTGFTVGDNDVVNGDSQTYVAYLFAHNAGGFGLTGTDNVISCGSFTTDGSGNATVSLGYEPQWLLYKSSSTANAWIVVDTMRGWNTSATDAQLAPNLSSAEVAAESGTPNATGFNFVGVTSQTYIYIAIRRGPMKVPTDGAKVYSGYSVVASSAGAAGNVINPSITPDFIYTKCRQITSGSDLGSFFMDRLRGNNAALISASTSAERNTTASGGNNLKDYIKFNVMAGDAYQAVASTNTASNDLISAHLFRRAPGFFDEVCYTGTGANKTEAHNLQKAPELWLVKSRSATTQWVFGSSLLGANEKIVMPSPNGRVTDTTVWNNTYPTASVLSLGTSSTTNANGVTFVSYLWATVAGVSKVGTYTGNGSSQTIDCGFAGGARFVMILRATASTAQDIYIWDTARGIVSGNDPRLSLNTTAAEVTTLDTIDTASSGFVVNTDASNVNVNGAVYLYLSIA